MIQQGTGRDSDGRRRSRLSLERLVGAALDVATEIGADRLTMKDVASRLGVGTMSLYYYVPDKAALLDAVVSRLYGTVSLPSRDDPWPAQVDAIARQVYVRFAGVPGLDPLAVSRQPPHEHRVRVVNGLLGALHDAGLSADDATIAATVVLGFAVGRGTAASRTPAAPADAQNGDRDGVRTPPPPGRLDQLAADQVFDFGLQLLIDGLAQRVTPSVS